MRDHGGNLDDALAIHGGTAGDWIDLSTGINRVPYPLPPIPASAWTDLPRRSAVERLIRAAAEVYRTGAAILPVAGAQAAIQMIPRLTAPGRARILGPTYNEHAAALSQAGWQVEDVGTAEALAGADLAVIVNPNNPDGRRLLPDRLRSIAGQVGRLVVDESFADPCPDISVAAQAGQVHLHPRREGGLDDVVLGLGVVDHGAVPHAADVRRLVHHPLGRQEAQRQLLVVTGGPHHHRHRHASDADLQRLLADDLVAVLVTRVALPVDPRKPQVGGVGLGVHGSCRASARGA